jgi:hypothetical protein
MRGETALAVIMTVIGKIKGETSEGGGYGEAKDSSDWRNR